MNVAAEQFAYWLTQAVWLIKANEGKPINIIQDELAMALGRASGEASIGYWRKGHVPATLDEVERLAALLAERRGLSRRSYEQFLRSAGHPRSQNLADRHFPNDRDDEPPEVGLTRSLPFSPNRPITDPRRFFGRERECRRVFNWWSGIPLQDVALVGPKKSGRTSLLHYLRLIAATPANRLRPGQRNDWLPDVARYRWVYVDFYDARWLSPISLLRHILAQLEFPIPEPLSLGTFMEAMSERVRGPVIIMLDELSAGLELPGFDRNFWHSMRALATSATRNQVAFVITASDDPQRLATSYGKTSPFFNLFTTLKIGPLNEDDGRALIASSPLPFAPADVDWIVSQSRCWPVILQALCQERLAALEDGDESDDWRAEAAVHTARYAYLLDGLPPPSIRSEV